MPNWTKEQEQAIYESGKNIIISAGAGSGKTAVLSERVLQKVLNGVSIDRLLILTFTNLAAREMKERIRKKIKKDENLKDQLNKLDASYITTFDSYSLSIVKKYHYLLNISSKVNIIDKNILDMQISKFIDEIFEQEYQENNPKFKKLITDFCIKNDDSIKKEIISLNDKLNMKYDKEDYLNNYLDIYYSDNFINKNINEYVSLIKIKVDNIKNLINDLYDFCDLDYVNKCRDALDKLLNATIYSEYLCVNTIKLPNVPRGTDEEGKAIKGKISDILKEIKGLVRFNSQEEMLEIIKSTQDYLEVIIDIIKKLDKKINDYKHHNDLYDFVDISKLAIKIVKENKEIREEIKNYFQEILVDEYQDTSDLQEEFISLIANNNVYMVGDIKQSIYRFRNANPNIFKNKYDNYAKHNGGMKIDLLKNFRSRSEVLNNINLLFRYILDDYIGGADYKKSHEMVYGNTSYSEIGHTLQNYDFEIYNYEYDKELGFSKNEIEAFIIADDIIKKVENHYQVFDKDEGILRDITYDDFVILIDRSTPFELYKKIFLYKQIPINILMDEYLNNSDDLLVIKNIFKLLKLVSENNYNQEFVYSFLSLGRSFLFNLEDNYLFEIIKNKSYQETIIMEKIKLIKEGCESLTISGILDKIIEVFDYYHLLIKIGNINESIVRIDYLYDLASNLSNLGYDYLSFSDYIENIFKEERDIRFSLNSESSNSVKIMSIHKSKGLEYHICYFPCLYPKFNESDLKEKFIYDHQLGIITPYFNEGIGNNFYKDLFKENYRKEEIGEKIRLFYVAMTRAKEKMILVIPNEESIESYSENDIVINDIRMQYNSFLKMINSVKSKIQDYFVNIDLSKLNLSKEYNLIKKGNVFENIDSFKEKIILKERPIIEKIEINNNRFSKTSNDVITKEAKAKMEFGTYMHYLLEIIDFKNPKLEELEIDKIYVAKINNFLNCDLLKNIHHAEIYREYEFIYKEENEEKHGFIDLMLEYDDHIDIIDYKLKNIDDHNYELQLLGYRDYIKGITGKVVNVYLYSIIDGVYKEIKSK